MEFVEKLLHEPVFLGTLFFVALCLFTGLILAGWRLWRRRPPRLGDGEADTKPYQMVPEWLSRLDGDVQQLRRQLCLDPLTGLPTARFLEQAALPDAITRSEQLGQALCVAILDIDGLREFNQIHGHHAGDRRLVNTAIAAQAVLSRRRGTDKAYRRHRGEFVILLPGANLKFAEEILEEILIEARSVTVNISIGAVVMKPEMILAPLALLKQAARAMTQVKQAGGNDLKIELAAPEVEMVATACALSAMEAAI